MGNIANLRTDDSLIEALKEASAKKLTHNEMLEQRVSFVYGSISSKSGVTRERVREMLQKQEGTTGE